MKLHRKTIRHLAEMICGAAGAAGGFERPNFPYRSSSYLTRFFEDCGFDHVHTAGTRVFWVIDVLEELNGGKASNPYLPPDGIIRVVQELLDVEHFEDTQKREAALEDVNEAMKRDGLRTYLDQTGTTHVHRVATGADSKTLVTVGREWTGEEKAKIDALNNYIDQASEDEFTAELLVPLLSRLGFQRLSVAGHEDKALEYGKDLWMKYRLPTGHWLYFGVQVKKGTIDSAGMTKTGRANITEILNQVRMAIEHPLLDPEVNRKVLVDHVYVIVSGTITKQARNWLAGQLDASKRRHLIFMDRDEVHELFITSAMPLPIAAELGSVSGPSDDDIPF